VVRKPGRHSQSVGDQPGSRHWALASRLSEILKTYDFAFFARTYARGIPDPCARAGAPSTRIHAAGASRRRPGGVGVGFPLLPPAVHSRPEA